MTFNRFLAVAFFSIIIGISVANTIRTQKAILKVDEFFVRARTVQTAQLTTNRCNTLLEDQIFQNRDLRSAFKEMVAEYQRLSFAAEDVRIEADIYLQVIHEQLAYISQLQSILQDNKLPVPVPKQPQINLEPQVCPTPESTPESAPEQDRSAENSFNLQRPTIPIPNALPTSPGGQSQRNSTVRDVSGTAGLLAA